MYTLFFFFFFFSFISWTRDIFASDLSFLFLFFFALFASCEEGREGKRYPIVHTPVMNPCLLLKPTRNKKKTHTLLSPAAMESLLTWIKPLAAGRCSGWRFFRFPELQLLLLDNQSKNLNLVSRSQLRHFRRRDTAWKSQNHRVTRLLKSNHVQQAQWLLNAMRRGLIPSLRWLLMIPVKAR